MVYTQMCLLGLVCLMTITRSASDHELVDLEDAAKTIQRDLSQFKLLVQRNKLDEGKKALKSLIEAVSNLEYYVVDPSYRRKELKDKSKSVEFDTGARWSLETTHHPKKCSRRALPGHRVKVHFVMKLLGNNRIADSSFKTGSMPRRFVLESDEAPPAWSRALRGACVGERRTAIVPWKLGYGPAGEASVGVPPRADLKLIFEVVDVGSKPVPGFEPAAATAGSSEETDTVTGGSDGEAEGGLSEEL